RPQMEEARANMRKVLEPNSVVITAEEVGRPAENISYYSGIADSFYLTDLQRWHIKLRAAATTLLVAGGKRPYLYVPTNYPNKDAMLDELRSVFTVERVADIAPPDAMAHFVAAPFHRGVRMELYRLSMPAIEEALRKSRSAPSQSN